MWDWFELASPNLIQDSTRGTMDPIQPTHCPFQLGLVVMNHCKLGLHLIHLDL